MRGSNLQLQGLQLSTATAAACDAAEVKDHQVLLEAVGVFGTIHPQAPAESALKAWGATDVGLYLEDDEGWKECGAEEARARRAIEASSRPQRSTDVGN